VDLLENHSSDLMAQLAVLAHLAVLADLLVAEIRSAF
jgi:hypothetical protein